MFLYFMGNIFVQVALFWSRSKYWSIPKLIKVWFGVTSSFDGPVMIYVMSVEITGTEKTQTSKNLFTLKCQLNKYI